jgi:hypothetical protein
MRSSCDGLLCIFLIKYYQAAVHQPHQQASFRNLSFSIHSGISYQNNFSSILEEWRFHNIAGWRSVEKDWSHECSWLSSADAVSFYRDFIANITSLFSYPLSANSSTHWVSILLVANWRLSQSRLQSCASHIHWARLPQRFRTFHSINERKDSQLDESLLEAPGIKSGEALLPCLCHFCLELPSRRAYV